MRESPRDCCYCLTAFFAVVGTTDAGGAASRLA
jgi:hypothetical protein